MALAQLYYTSCERGLSGYAGFQFNAATPGVPAETMLEIERLTSYEPPSTVPHRPSAEEIRGCPVNLCFTPVTESGQAVVANVVFVGADYSQRFGNYFAHALSSGNLPEDLDGRLPIELWRASTWVADESPDPQLPYLVPGPKPGPMTRAAVETFLSAGDGALGRLPSLLSAAERAVCDQDRSVVVVERDSDQAAAWIAAVSYLLPPALARSLSFATYTHRPSRGREAMMGTVPGTEISSDPHAAQGYYLFDFVGDTHSDVPVHPLADLLSGIGPVAAGQVWTHAMVLASGNERRFGDWHAVVAAGALLCDTGIADTDLHLVTGWLQDRGRTLPRVTVAALGKACLSHDAADPRDFARLADIGHAVGEGDMVATAESRLVQTAIGEIRASDRLSSRPAALRSAGGRAYAANTIAEELIGADGPRALEVLRLADALRVDVDPDTLFDIGQRSLGRTLLRAGRVESEIAALVQRWTPLRTGVLEYLDRAPDDAASQVTGILGDLGTAVPDTELQHYPRLQRMALLLRRDDPVSTLSRLADLDAVDAAAVATLWPAGMSSAEVIAALAALPAMYRPVLAVQIQQIILGATATDGYADLCLELAQLGYLRYLTSEAGERVRLVCDAVAAAAAVEGTDSDRARSGFLKKALDRLGDAEPVVVDVVCDRVVAMLNAVGPKPLARAIPDCPAVIKDAYFEAALQALDRRVADRDRATTMFAARIPADAHPPTARRIEETLRKTLPWWRGRDLDAVHQALRGVDSTAAREFLAWREKYAKKGLSRLFAPRS